MVSHFYPIGILLGGVKIKCKKETSLKENFLISKSHSPKPLDIFLKVHPKLKQITKDGRGNYCDGEIKERFVNIIPILPYLTLSFKMEIACFGVLPSIDKSRISSDSKYHKIAVNFEALPQDPTKSHMVPHGPQLRWERASCVG